MYIKWRVNCIMSRRLRKVNRQNNYTCAANKTNWALLLRHTGSSKILLASTGRCSNSVFFLSTSVLQQMHNTGKACVFAKTRSNNARFNPSLWWINLKLTVLISCQIRGTSYLHNTTMSYQSPNHYTNKETHNKITNHTNHEILPMLWRVFFIKFQLDSS